TLLKGRDYCQFYWLMHAAAMVRPGSDLVLAWVVSLTGLSAHQAFMPLILAFHLVLVSAAGALVFRSAEDAQPAWWTCALLTLSALTTLGTLYQLIAQVAGLALLAGCVTVLLRIPHDLDRVAAARYGFLAALLVSALLVVYPEIFPFLVLAFLAHLAVTWRRWLAAPRP